MAIDWMKLLAVAAAVARRRLLLGRVFLYPLKLLPVLIHESGHALAAWAAGARDIRLVIDPRQGGGCTFRIAPRFISEVAVASAGYLGSSLAGALLLLETLRRGSGRLLLWLMCGLLALVCVLWARSVFSLGAALGMSIAFDLGARYLLLRRPAPRRSSSRASSEPGARSRLAHLPRKGGDPERTSGGPQKAPLWDLSESAGLSAVRCSSPCALVLGPPARWHSTRWGSKGYRARCAAAREARARARVLRHLRWAPRGRPRWRCWR